MIFLMTYFLTQPNNNNPWTNKIVPSIFQILKIIFAIGPNPILEPRRIFLIEADLLGNT